jgi:predicted aspartyl protease
VTGRTVQFTDLLAAVNGIPRGEVVLHGPGGPRGYTKARFQQVLVDTGATHTHLPDNVLAPIGLSTQGATPVNVQVMGGSVTCQQLPVDIEVEGTVCRVDVCFGNNSTPLIGRSTLYKLFTTTGFTSADWLRELPPPPQPGDSGEDAEQAETDAAARAVTGVQSIAELKVQLEEIQKELNEVKHQRAAWHQRYLKLAREKITWQGPRAE